MPEASSSSEDIPEHWRSQPVAVQTARKQRLTIRAHEAPQKQAVSGAHRCAPLTRVRSAE
jgi:hypothetical protein